MDFYEDVIVCSKITNCYFVLIDNAIGIYDLNGNLIVPPIPGKIILGKGLLCLGESTTQKEFDNWMSIAKSGAVKNKDMKCWLSGTFCCVLNSKDLSPIIPYGLYDEIHMTYRGGLNFDIYFAVARFSDNEKKWGVLDANGNELVPCEYKRFACEDKKIVGKNDANMDDFFAQKMERLTYARDNQKHPLQQFGSFLVKVFNAMGNGIVAADQFMNNSGGYALINNLASVYNNNSANYSTYSSSESGELSSSSKTNSSGGMSLTDAQNYQSLRNTYNKWANDLIQMKNANGQYSNGYTQSDKKHAQSEMKRIRQSAKSKFGKEIPYNSIEDW
ncbi:MAG: WG repeat-containing protein [Muribaculaceae bacterium]|nr:WG repeat-containing protein [Muribaculaceae bacterium]